MAELDLEVIAARADAADDGPWGRDEHSLYVHNAERQAVADFDWHASTCEEYEQLEANAAFVAAARTDVPALLRTVRSLLGQLTDAHNDLKLAVGDGFTTLNSAAVEAIRRIAELQARVDVLTVTVNGRDEQIARVDELHREWKLYDEDECNHGHEEGEPGVVEVFEVGLVCEDAYVKSICRECCTDRGEFQSLECTENHGGLQCWPCRTRVALDGEPAESEAKK